LRLSRYLYNKIVVLKIMFVALLCLLIEGILQHVSTTGNQESKRCRGGEDRAIIVAINSNCPHFLFKKLVFMGMSSRGIWIESEPFYLLHATIYCDRWLTLCRHRPMEWSIESNGRYCPLGKKEKWRSQIRIPFSL
jgi:hypothetical protein